MVFAVDYELHQRGSEISTIQMKAEDPPNDWNGEPMDYQLIINPTAEDEL